MIGAGKSCHIVPEWQTTSAVGTDLKPPDIPVIQFHFCRNHPKSASDIVPYAYRRIFALLWTPVPTALRHAPYAFVILPPVLCTIHTYTLIISLYIVTM